MTLEDIIECKRLYASGISLDDIAKLYGITRKELVDLVPGIREQLIALNVQVSEAVLSMAIGGNLSACQFWLKNRAGWDSGATSKDGNEEQLIEEIRIKLLDSGDKDAEVIDKV